MFYPEFSDDDVVDAAVDELPRIRLTVPATIRQVKGQMTDIYSRSGHLGQVSLNEAAVCQK